MSRRASDPWLDGLPPHVPSDRTRLPSVALLPGDPSRVELTGEVLDEFHVIGRRREFTLGIGRYEGAEIVVCSTGIGGPSTEIAVVELSRLGVRTMIRVGGMGALEPGITPGTITQVQSTLRLEASGGAARFYRPSVEPIPATAEVVAALERAGSDLGEAVVPIAVLSCDSYYLGQGRDLPGMESAAAARRDAIAGSGAQALDMECETVFAVGQSLDVRVGALLVAHGNRATDEWLEDYESAQRRMLHVALSAATALS